MSMKCRKYLPEGCQETLNNRKCTVKNFHYNILKNVY